MTVTEMIVQNGTNGMILRRWAATWIDFLVLFCFFLVPELLLGNLVYSYTIPAWVILAILYFPILEGFWGFTVGKLLLRIRVVNDNFLAPGIIKSSIRTIFRIVEVNPVLLGGLPAGIVAALSPKSQRIGDMVAKTFVILHKDSTKYRIAINENLTNAST